VVVVVVRVLTADCRMRRSVRPSCRAVRSLFPSLRLFPNSVSVSAFPSYPSLSCLIVSLSLSVQLRRLLLPLPPRRFPSRPWPRS
jgi:hypothetical protein